MSALTDWVDVKYNHILEELHSLFDEGSEKKLKATTFMHPIICNVLNLDNPKTRKEDDRSFTDSDDLEYCFRVYQSLIAEINLYTLLVPSIETYAMFMGWTSAIVRKVANDSSPEIQAVMDFVDDYIIDSQLSAGQTGFARPNMTKFRAQLTGNHGQGLMTAKEESSSKRKSDGHKSKSEIYAELEQFGFRIESKK